MRRKEIITFSITTICICCILALVTSQDAVIKYFTDKGYTLQELLINASLIALIIILLVFNLLIISNKNNHKKQIIIDGLLGDIDRLNHHITKTITSNKKTLEEKINSLNKLTTQKLKITKELNAQIEEQKKEREEYNKNIDKMTHGVQYLYYILNNETELELNKEETLNFISCYKLIDSSFVEKLEQVEEGKITPKEELFCILHRLNKSPEETRLMLNLSKDAYRQLKFRTLKRIKDVKGLKSFCDNLQKQTISTEK